MKYKINCISHNRPKNVQRPIYQPEAENITYYVGMNESGDYYNAGAKHVIESGRFTESLNRALSDSKKSGFDCIVIDDDLKDLRLAVDKDQTVKVSIADVAKEMQNVLYNELRGILYLSGIAPTDNIFYYHPARRLSFRNFIISSFMYIRQNTDLVFDTQFGTKMDYDYTLQHIRRYGGAARLNYVLATFEHYNNKGGFADYRTTELEQDSIKKLKSKWGNIIKDNPRRENEILMRVPSTK
jgi:hypothetical protein